MDLTTLGLLLALGFGLLGVDAALNANTFGIHINVPAELEAQGINQHIAEEVFTSEVIRIAQTPSLLAPPTVRSTSEKTIIGAVASSMNLDDVTFTMQKLLGLNPVRLTGALLHGEARPRFFLTGATQATGAFMIDLRGESEDYIELVRRGAQLAIERAGPYRAALFHFAREADSIQPDFSVAETIALRELALAARPSTLVRRAYLHNLLGIIALMRNDPIGAERQFRDAISEGPKEAIGYINLAFVQVHFDHYRSAIETIRRVFEPDPLTEVPQLLAAAETTWAVSAWGDGRPAEAERLFEGAARRYMGATATYEHWAQLLERLGRKDEAAEKMRLAAAHRPYFDNYPEVAMLYFALTATNGDPLIRR